MVMEAMRLSLLEHEAQQRKQQEEEAKKQREAAAVTETASNSPAEPPAATTTFTDSVPHPPTSSEGFRPIEYPATTGDSMAEPPRTTAPGQIPAHLTLTSDAHNGHESDQSTPTSQHGAIGTTVLSATPTTSTITTPDTEHESNQLAEPTTVAELALAPERSSATVVEGQSLQETPPISVDSTHDGAEPSSEHSSESPALPSGAPSLASSLSPSYDVLPSSPESAFDKPLLANAIPSPSGPGEEDSQTTTSC